MRYRYGMDEIIKMPNENWLNRDDSENSVKIGSSSEGTNQWRQSFVFED